jgi:hypothetical protein
MDALSTRQERWIELAMAHDPRHQGGYNANIKAQEACTDIHLEMENAATTN